MYPLLESIDNPTCLRRLEPKQLNPLAEELRAYILETVSQSGGHLSSNLGTVELAIALHYVFNTPDDALIWDVGHQSYAHKILTGRRQQMATLRQFGGISGFPRRSESPYDTFGTAHSSTSISAALGMARAAQHQKKDPVAIAVIGDGAVLVGVRAGQADIQLHAVDHLRVVQVTRSGERGDSHADQGTAPAARAAVLRHHRQRERRGHQIP